MRRHNGLTVFCYEDYPSAPWKHGHGITRDIFKSDSNGLDFKWRLSLADVSTSGDFSEFSGYERTITLLEGEGFSLDFKNGRQKKLAQIHEPFVFDGGAPVTCTLFGGPSKDLNLMIRRGQATARWWLHNVSTVHDLDLDGECIHLLFCLCGHFEIQEMGKASYPMKAWDCAKFVEEFDAVVSIKPTTPSKYFHIKISIP